MIAYASGNKAKHEHPHWQDVLHELFGDGETRKEENAPIEAPSEELDLAIYGVSKAELDEKRAHFGT